MHARSFINFWLHKPSYTQHKPISIISNHKFIRPSVISKLGDFSPQPIHAQPNFRTLFFFFFLTKVANAHPSLKYFHIMWVSHERGDIRPSVHMKISRKCFIFYFYFGDFSKLSTFFETLGISLHQFTVSSTLSHPIYLIHSRAANLHVCNMIHSAIHFHYINHDMICKCDPNTRTRLLMKLAFSWPLHSWRWLKSITNATLFYFSLSIYCIVAAYQVQIVRDGNR